MIDAVPIPHSSGHVGGHTPYTAFSMQGGTMPHKLQRAGLLEPLSLLFLESWITRSTELDPTLFGILDRGTLNPELQYVYPRIFILTQADEWEQNLDTEGRMVLQDWRAEAENQIDECCYGGCYAIHTLAEVWTLLESHTCRNQRKLYPWFYCNVLHLLQPDGYIHCTHSVELELDEEDQEEQIRDCWALWLSKMRTFMDIRYPGSDLTYRYLDYRMHPLLESNPIEDPRSGRLLPEQDVIFQKPYQYTVLHLKIPLPSLWLEFSTIYDMIQAKIYQTLMAAYRKFQFTVAPPQLPSFRFERK